ncbi:MAG TPA: TonB-dependent receptor [Pyrinomonadaceae bacterium]|nr:TonB-dependent receptor [Pyrinomonadaceae bacterium]
MFKFFRFSFIAILMVAMSALAFAQSTTTGAIGITAADPNGAVVPNATVTIRNTETNKEETVTTDSEGRARAVNLQPGNYTVVISTTGFGTYTQENVVVEVGRVTSVDAALQVGQTTGTVDVVAEAPVINTTQQDFSTNINQTSINELPINGRRASNFVLLTPGTAPDGDFGLISFRGISGLLNNSTVDGGDNNNAFFAEERGRTRISYVISQAAVREFQVNTSNYSAEYGRAAGGVVNTVTKSGTNDFHGSIFYYIRDNKLGARNAFGFRTLLVNGVATPVAFKPDDRRQQFGGTLGGPIVKDKLFFFFSYDQQRRNFPGIAAFASPTFLNLSGGNRTTIRNNIAPAFPGETNAQLDARIDAVRAGLNTLTGEVPRRADQYIILPKIDWQINSNHTLTVTYNRLRAELPAGVESPPVVTQGIGSFGDDFVDVDTLIPRLTSTITPTILNEARFQYSRENARQIQRGLTPFENALAAGATVSSPSGRLPQVDIARTSVGIRFGNRDFLDRRAFPDERRFQFADTMTINHGNHTFKFGGDINYTKDKVDNLRLGEGAYSYSNLVNFISDVLNPGRRYSNFQQAFGLTAFELSTTDYNFFLQDDWRVSPRLTLNLGLRYEYQKQPSPQVPNQLANLPNQIIGPEQTRQIPTDANNFGPRIGFAYDITGDGKTSIRGGYGIYYGRVINSTISNAITATGAPGSTLNIFTTPGPLAPIFPNVLPGPIGVVDIVAFSPDFSNPMIHQADIVFEREIADNTVVSISYLFSRGTSLPNFIDRNLNAPTTTRTFTVIGGDFGGQTFTSPVFVGARPDTRFGRITEITSNVESKYHGLVLQANRRLNRGLQFQTSYTFSRSRDNGQNSVTFTTGNNILNPFNVEGEEAISNFDIPHKFVASAVWTPFNTFTGLEHSTVGRAIFRGLTIAPIVLAQSGRPLTPFVSGNLPGGTAGGIIGAAGNSRPFFLERNTFRRPKQVSVDLRLSKRFNFSETMNIEFLAEAFNLFNHTNVTNVADRLYSVGGTNAAPTLTFDPTFLNPTEAGNTIFRERQIQLAVRFEF